MAIAIARQYSSLLKWTSHISLFALVAFLVLRSWMSLAPPVSTMSTQHPIYLPANYLVVDGIDNVKQWSGFGTTAGAVGSPQVNMNTDKFEGDRHAEKQYITFTNGYYHGELHVDYFDMVPGQVNHTRVTIDSPIFTAFDTQVGYYGPSRFTLNGNQLTIERKYVQGEGTSGVGLLILILGLVAWGTSLLLFFGSRMSLAYFTKRIRKRRG